MKKLYVYLISGAIAGSALALNGCSSGISSEEYNSVAAEASEAQNEASTLESKVNELNANYESLSAEYNANYESLSAEYNAYKESMKPYEELSEAEANARKIEVASKAAEESAALESSKAAKAAEESAAAAAAEASKAAEEAKGYETGITYEQLARTPNDYIDKKVKFKGKVIQVMEGGDAVQIRLIINNNYDTVILGAYKSNIVSSRILENDVITIYGISKGLYTYQSTMGGAITIPSVLIEKIDQ